MWRDAVENRKLAHDLIPRPNRLIMRSGMLVVLASPGLKALNDLVVVLMSDEKIKMKLSKRALETMLTDALFEVAETGPTEIVSSVERATERLLEKIAADPIEWKVLFPISNLRLGLPELTLGVVSFLRPDMFSLRKQEIESLLAEIDPVRKGASFFEKSTLFDESALAEVNVRSLDDAQAQDLAERELEKALSVLRFIFAPAYRDRRMFVDLKGRTWSTQFDLAVYSRSAKRVILPQAIAGYFEPMEIPAEILEVPLLKKLQQVLFKGFENQTELERRLLSALRMFASALGQANDRSALQGLISSLEGFLLREYGPRKELLAERLAFILGKNATSRKEIYTRMKELYQLRSDLTHGREVDGKEVDVSAADLHDLTNLTFACYVWITSSLEQFKNLAELLLWIENAKFA